MCENPGEFMQDFSRFVREKREALGMSVKELSLLVTGNDRSNYISQIENGNRKGITMDMMEKILKAMNCKIKYID